MKTALRARAASVSIYAKREGCHSGLAMGGNKLRKLEFIADESGALREDGFWFIWKGSPGLRSECHEAGDQLGINPV